MNKITPEITRDATQDVNATLTNTNTHNSVSKIMKVTPTSNH